MNRSSGGWVRSCAHAWWYVAACLAVSGGGPATATPPERPNILLFLGDDHTYLDLGCYGNAEVRTPHMDRLAREGLLFSRAYTATAMCAPSRQQLYTGMFPVRNGAYPNHSRIRDGVQTLPSYFAALGYRVALAGKSHVRPPAAYPFEYLPGPGVNQEAVREFMTRDRAQPFVLVACSSSPHVPWTEGDAAAYDPATLTIPPHLIDAPEMRSALTRYYAEITALDAELGAALQHLDEAGLADQTLVMYTSEQGAQHPFCKWTCYETGLRVALIARWPGRVRPGSVTDAMVQYVDVLPTLLEAVGAEAPADLDGRSFLATLEGRAARHHDFVYGVHTTKGIIAGTPEGYPVRSVRDERYKLILNLNPTAEFRNLLTQKDEENYWHAWVREAQVRPEIAGRVAHYQRRPELELYDLQKDPFELRNLADDPAMQPQIVALRERLAAWMEEQGDRGMETEWARAARNAARAAQTPSSEP